jgi:carboxypeptidase PM20D1
MKKKLARICGALLGLLVLLLVVLLLNSLRFRSRQVQAPPPTPGLEARVEALLPEAARRLSQAVQVPTVSYQEPERFDAAQFAALRDLLRRSFPRVHQQLQVEPVAGHSLLYTWPGADPALRPVVLLAHMDVVPIEPGTESAWSQPPFSGAVRDGFVWGRGTLDDKGPLLAILEAAELLLGQGHRPPRTVYLAFGHDEELAGTGAAAVARLLHERGVRPEWVLDEGLAITRGILPGLRAPVALIGIAEKGYLTVELSVALEGGHSSMPPRESAIGVLSRALSRLEQHQLPAEISGPAQELFQYVGPEMPFRMRAVFANLWLLRPLVVRIFLGQPATAALVRTTTALTQISGGVKENVLASSARGVINFRIRPGDTVAGVLDHVRRTVADPRVHVRPLGPGREPVPPAPTAAPGFQLLLRALRQVAPDFLAAPSLMLGATDSRHYRELTENIYRFVPIVLTSEDLGRLHGTNERIALTDYARCIRFYAELLKQL